MTNAATSKLASILHAGFDVQSTDPSVLRHVSVLNGLMLASAALSFVNGLVWGAWGDASFAVLSLGAFAYWASLSCVLAKTRRVILVGRLGVVGLFLVCTAFTIQLGGKESTILAWFMILPLAAAVCVGKSDLWFWALIAAIVPTSFHLYADPSLMPPRFSPDVTDRLIGISLAMGALIVSILTSIWMSQQETLARRLDQTVGRLEKEADAQRLLVELTMLTNSEQELNHGVEKLLIQLQEANWVEAAGFWDIRNNREPGTAQHTQPPTKLFTPTPSLVRAIHTGKRTVSAIENSSRQTVYYPVTDGSTIAGVLAAEAGSAHSLQQEGDWLLQQLVVQLGHLAERERTAKMIQQEAESDALTKLQNRRAFEYQLEEEIANAQAKSSKLALLYIDLNDFKRINDSLGHEAGDRVLQVVAKRLRETLRANDEAHLNTDIISRVGGDEFTLLLRNTASTTDVENIAQRIIASLAAPIDFRGKDFRVGASIGIAFFPDDATQPDTLVRSADAAMYSAKRRGKSGYSRYRDTDKAFDTLSFEVEIQRAIEEQQLEMHYQPVFNCQKREPVGVEALIRWHHPQRGWVSPGEFIPQAEDLGLIIDIGKFQFDAALTWFKATRSQLPADFRLALNLSPAQITNTDFVTWLILRLEDSALPMSCIELEITETALLMDTRDTQTNVRALSDMGVCITLDDFGTGQSSLSLLKRFPIGRIKIDRSFVSGLPDNSEDIAIVGAVLSLAHSLDIPVVGEGVEEEAQLEFLKARNCNDIQGYLLGRPMPGASIVSTLMDDKNGQLRIVS